MNLVGQSGIGDRGQTLNGGRNLDEHVRLADHGPQGTGSVDSGRRVVRETWIDFDGHPAVNAVRPVMVSAASGLSSW